MVLFHPLFLSLTQAGTAAFLLFTPPVRRLRGLVQTQLGTVTYCNLVVDLVPQQELGNGICNLVNVIFVYLCAILQCFITKMIDECINHDVQF